MPLQKPALKATALSRGTANLWQAQLMLRQEACGSAVPNPGDTAGGTAAPRQPFCSLPTAAARGRGPAVEPAQHQHPLATGAMWSGFHQRTFDGRCAYLLAGAADSGRAAHLPPEGHCPRTGRCQLVQGTMGPEEVLIQGREVLVKGKRVPDGEARLLPGLSLQWQGDWLLLSGGLGVVVRLDRSSSISISLDHELWGQTQGLCGFYSGQPEGDSVEPGGGLAMLAATFGSSWRLPSSEVSPSEYHETCLFAYCASAATGGQKERRGAVCATFASYTQACARWHIHVRWRKPGFCERLCPGGQLYSDCVSSCPPGCSAVGQGEEGSCGEECVSGCERPPTLFWDGALCVPAARCPCYDRRHRHAPGDTVYQRCHPRVCQDGRWSCAKALCPAECAVGGDGHYFTFDGRSFSFRGGPGCL